MLRVNHKRRLLTALNSWLTQSAAEADSGIYLKSSGHTDSGGPQPRAWSHARMQWRSQDLITGEWASTLKGVLLVLKALNVSCTMG